MMDEKDESIMGILYIVSTPIGNLQDVSLRAIEILRTVDAIACEDTRRTGNFLKMLQITKRFEAGCKPAPASPYLISYYEQNELRRIPEIINSLKNGLNVALVSDAGTPAVSDPGFKLIREAVANGIKVEAIPGASAVLAALVVSGLPTDKFLFMGYLPKKDGHKKKTLEEIRQMAKFVKTTIIFYEAPHRLQETLELLQTEFGDIHVVVCAELTKMFEETIMDNISNLIEYYKKKKVKGEFVILFTTSSIFH